MRNAPMILVQSSTKAELDAVTDAICRVLQADCGDDPKSEAMKCMAALVTPRPVEISGCTFTNAEVERGR